MSIAKDRVQSVVFAHQILNELSLAGRAVSLAYLAKALKMTPPRILRHLSTLVELQLVVREGSEPVYHLGTELLRLSERANHQQDVIRVAYPHLVTLNETTGQAVYLVRAHRNGAVIWTSLQSDDTPYLMMPPGMSFSLSGSATGRVLLAFADIEFKLDGSSRSQSSNNPDPVASAKELKLRLEQIRERGYDHYGTEKSDLGLFSLGVPILDHDRVAIAAIGMVGFTASYQVRGSEALKQMQHCGALVSAAMGAQHP